MELLVLCGAHREGLDVLLLGHWFLNTGYLLHLVLFVLPSGMLPGDFANPCCLQCLPRAVVMLCRPGVAGLRLACNVCTSSLSPTMAYSPS